MGVGRALLGLRELPLGAVEAASQLLRRDGVPGGAAGPGEARPHLGGHVGPTRGRGDRGPARSSGAAEGKFGTPVFFPSAFPLGPDRLLYAGTSRGLGADFATIIPTGERSRRRAPWPGRRCSRTRAL